MLKNYTISFDRTPLQVFNTYFLGSCFPPDFGGKCSGIPELCSACNIVCTDNPGMEIVVHYDEEGKTS